MFGSELDHAGCVSTGIEARSVFCGRVPEEIGIYGHIPISSVETCQARHISRFGWVPLLFCRSNQGVWFKLQDDGKFSQNGFVEVAFLSSGHRIGRKSCLLG